MAEAIRFRGAPFFIGTVTRTPFVIAAALETLGFNPAAGDTSLSATTTGGTPAIPRIEFSSARFSARNRATSASSNRVYFVLLTRRIHSITVILCLTLQPTTHPKHFQSIGTRPVPSS